MMTRCAASPGGVSVLALILVLAAGCQPRTREITKIGFLSKPEVGVSPVGTKATIKVRAGGGERIVAGELIAVRTDGFLILSDETTKLTLIPYDRMTQLDFEDDVGAKTSVDRSRGPWFGSIPPLQEDGVRQRAMALFSRYPLGLDDAQLQSLLEVFGQSELVVVGS